jgi:hypothetical protein
MTHTPKPWIKGKAGGCVIAPDADSRETDDAERKFYGGYLIAESINKVDDINLIIAAPDLLDVLEKVEKACKATGNYIGQNGQLIKEVRAAITRAKGTP